MKRRCGNGSWFSNERRVPGAITIVVGMVWPPVILMRMGSCGGAVPDVSAAMQISRDGFALKLRNSAFTVGEGSRQGLAAST